MENLQEFLHYEKGQREFEDYFGFADRHPEDVDGIRALMPTAVRFHTFMDAVKAVSPAPIYFAEITDEKNGCYGHAKNEVYVNWRIAPVMAFRTALHEMTHAILHPWPDGVRHANEIPRAIRETEAECVACLVCLHYGLDVRAYSVDYIQSWMRHLSSDEAEWSLALAERTAQRLVAAIDAELEKMRGPE